VRFQMEMSNDNFGQMLVWGGANLNFGSPTRCKNMLVPSLSISQLRERNGQRLLPVLLSFSSR
jgi:hypothetical protein